MAFDFLFVYIQFLLNNHLAGKLVLNYYDS